MEFADEYEENENFDMASEYRQIYGMVIEAICATEDIDFDWLSEDILKAYHAKKVDVIEMNDGDTEEIIRNAIQKIRQ